MRSIADIITGIVEIIVGVLIATTFILIYKFSDFSNCEESVQNLFEILYLYVFPIVGAVFVILGLYHILRKKDMANINEENK